MSVYLGASGKIIKITSNFPTLAGFTACGFCKWKTKNGAYQIICGFEGIGLNGALWIGWEPSSQFNIFSDAGVTAWRFASEPAADTWFFWAITNSGAGANTYKGYWQNVGTSGAGWAATQTGDSSAFAIGPAQLSLGNDTEDEWADVVLAGTKIYSAVLTSGELAQESKRILPYRTANLNRFSPHGMTNSTEWLKDYSANQFDWASAGALAGEVNPPVPWA